MDKLEYMGQEFDSIKSLADHVEISAATLRYRLSKGWSVTDAVQTPVAEIPKKIIYEGKTYDSIAKFAEAMHLDYQRLYIRLSYGWSLEDAVQTPVKQTGNQTIYQGKEYSSVKALAEELKIPYSILSHHANRTESIEEAVEKSYASLASKPVLWGNVYESYEEIAQVYGINPGSISNRLAQGITLESAVLQILSAEPVRFQGRVYSGIPELSMEFSMQPDNVYDRLVQGMSLEEALTRPIRHTTRGKQVEYEGKLFPSQISLCREYGISNQCVHEQLKRHSIPFTEMVRVFVRLKEAVGMPKDHPLYYIPRCIMNGKPYKRLRDLTKQFGISDSVVTTYQCTYGMKTLFDTLRSMQKKTVAHYLVDGKAVPRKELERQGYNSLKLFRMKYQKTEVPLYPGLQGYDFETDCYDTLYIYRQLLLEAEQADRQEPEEQEAEESEWELTM